MRTNRWLAPLALACLAAVPGAQEPDSYLPEDVALEEFVGLPIDDFVELGGRAVLLEFFAYW